MPEESPTRRLSRLLWLWPFLGLLGTMIAALVIIMDRNWSWRWFLGMPLLGLCTSFGYLFIAFITTCCQSIQILTNTLSPRCDTALPCSQPA